MGSGSSKAKKSEPPKARLDKVSKVQVNQSKSLQSDSNKLDQNSNKNQKNVSVIDNEKVKNDRNIENVPDRTKDLKSNGNVTKKPTTEKLQSFESDSESEAEDINAVLAATRAEHSYRAKQSEKKASTEYYPESYAQRLQREQYEKAQQGLMRQKTIYRNPDEWDVDEMKDDFDVGKFKEANVAKLPQNPVNRDIFSPPDVTPQSNGYHGKTDKYYNMNNNQKTDSGYLPRYDTSEEALLAEIEQEFEL